MHEKFKIDEEYWISWYWWLKSSSSFWVASSSYNVINWVGDNRPTTINMNDIIFIVVHILSGWKNSSKCGAICQSSVCLSVCVSVCLCVCLSVCVYVCLSVCLPVCSYILISICLDIHLPVCMPIFLFVSISGRRRKGEVQNRVK